jgi:hypothetical protein
MKRLMSAVAVCAALSVPSLSSAAIIRASTPACGGFSTCDDSAFVAAAGVALAFNDFSVDRFGGVLPAGNGEVAGDIYSADFTLSSKAGAFGGLTSASVTHGNGSSAESEVGPWQGFTGILDISFASPQAAVGFGTVEFGDNGVALEVIRVYNGGILLGTFDAISASTFNYEGFVATAGDVITRVELDGSFFAIQNIKYSTESVPEPVTMTLLGVGLLAGAAARRRRASK